jgi:carbamoyl-phosphate synthase large subunit
MNSKEDEPAIFEYDIVFSAPPLFGSRSEFEMRFEEVMSLVKPDLVIPCRDEDVAFLAGLAEERPVLRDRLLCGANAVAGSMLDKGQSWTFSQTHGLPFAPVVAADADTTLVEAFIQQHGFPVIAKPRRGFASQGVRLVLGHEQLDALLGKPDLILQQFLGDPRPVKKYMAGIQKEGIPLFHSFEETKTSVQGCIGPDGTVGGVFVTQNMMRQGKSECVEISEDSAALFEGTRWVAKLAELGWKGPINIQCQRDADGKLMIYEYNGRFTGATSARVLLGFDEVGITLKMWLGDQFPASGISSLNRVVVRAPMSRPVEVEKVNLLHAAGYWRP